MSFLNTRFFFITLFVLALSSCSSASYIASNNLLFVQGKYHEIITNYKKLIQETPENSDLYYQTSRVYFKLNNYKQAEEFILKALLLDPNIPSYRLLAGKIFYVNKEYFESINYLTSALALDDRLLEGYYFLAKAYGNAGESTKAIQQLDIVIAIEPLYFKAQLARLELQLKEKNGNQLQVLIAQTEKVLEINPASVEGTLLLSSMYFQGGSVFRSKSILENWLHQFQNNDKVLFALAKLLYQSGKNGEALKVIQNVKEPDLESKLLILKLKSRETPASDLIAKVNKLLQLHPNFLSALIFSGELEMDRGELIGAERIFRKATRIAPNSANAHFALAKVWGKQKDLSGRYWALEKAMNLAPENIEIQLAFLKILLEKGNIEKVAIQLNQLMVDPDDSRILFFKGLIAKNRGDYFKAEELFRDAQEEKYSPEIETEIALLEILRGQLGSAKIRLDQILSQFPDHYEAHIGKAKLYFQNKEYKNLLSLLEPYISQSLGTVEAPLLYGEALVQMGETEAAIEVFKNSLNTWPQDPDLVQAYTFYLGLVDQESEAIQILEEMQSFEHKYSHLFKNRLAFYYFQIGEKEKFLELRYQQNK